MLKRLLLSTALALFGLAGAVGAAATFDHDDDSRQTIVRPRDFTMPMGQCSQLPANLSVHGTGIERTTIRFLTPEEDGDDDAPGIRVVTTITGTATDNRGGTYHFSYRNRFAGPFPGTVVMTDTFRLTGDGAANGWFTFFRARVTFDAALNPIGFELIEQVGNPFNCDPL